MAYYWMERQMRNSIIVIIYWYALFKLLEQFMKQTNKVTIFIIILSLIPGFHSANEFDLTKSGKQGTMNSIVCNIQTTLDFSFSPSTTISGSSQTLSSPSSSTFQFLTASGLDVVLPLSKATLATNPKALSFVKGYGSRATTSPAITVSAAFIFQFTDNTNTVYVYIPVTTTSAKNNPDLVNLLETGEALGTFQIGTSTPLTPFNILNTNNYNQWYTAVVGSKTILVSNFVYQIKTITNSLNSVSWVDTVVDLGWPTAISSTGDKLCYASKFTTGNFQTHLRESVPLWFVWFWIFFYWLFYLISDSINTKVYDKHFENNRWTCVALYSLFNLAHEDFFTRLSRATVIFINWTIQGVFLAGIYGNNVLGSPMVIWSAIIAFVATIPFPFILGSFFFKKIQENNLIKFQNMKMMKGTTDKAKIQPYQKVVEECEQKLYGYYHWFYSIAFLLFFICWPIAINQMQKLGRIDYHYHWYWLASMGIVFALQYLILEPFLALLFANTDGMKSRGGYYYNFKLGEAYRLAQSN